MRWMLLLPLLELAWPAAANGERPAPRPSLLLAVFAGQSTSASTAREIRRLLAEALRRDHQVAVIDPLRSPAAGSSSAAADFVAWLDGGTEHLRAHRFSDAARELSRAIALIKASLAQVAKASLSRATLLLAMAELGAGRRAAALRALKDLLIWRPHDPLSPDLLPPQGWTRLAEEARAAVDALPRHDLSLSSVPPEAEAFIDGRRIGPTPQSVTGLVVGTHYVTLALEGYRRLVVPVSVREGRPNKLTVALQPDLQATDMLGVVERLRPSLGSDDLPALTELAHRFASPRALLIEVRTRAGGLTLRSFLYDLPQRRRLAGLTVESPWPPRPERLAGLVLWSARGASAAETGETATGEASATRVRPQRWYRRWWVWTALGVAVAAAVAVPVGISASQSGRDEKLILSW